MDWLHARQARIENKLAKKHLVDGALILYDLTSTYFEGRCCPLAKHGHSRDGKRDKLQIEFGLLCNAEGCPIAVHVFEGNTSDPATVSHQIETLRKRFGLKRFILIGDRGMLTEARVREDLSAHEGIDWITALRAPAIRQLYASKQIQMSLFDERNLAEIIDPERPNERLVVCLNPQLRDERRRKRSALLAATELELDKIVKATVRTNRPLRGKVPIGLRVGKVLNRFKVAKHFLLTIEDESFHYQRDHENIADEEAVDGLYVVRSSLAKDAMSSNELVKNYKRLASVERVFRSMKSVDLKVRPIHHHLENRVRAHVFLCMLAYYVEWHMRQSLAEVLFDDNEKDAAEKLRQTAADLAVRSPSAMEKARSKQTPDGLPVHSFQTLLSDLATITRNHLTFHSDNPAHQVTYCETTRLTPVQQRAIDLLQVSLHKER
jgi:transposase